MSRNKSGETSRLVDVKPGLHVLRYSSADDGKSPPFLDVEIPPEFHGKIELIPFPGVAGGALSAPGDLLVIRAFSPARLLLTISARKVGGSIAAELDLQDLSKAGAYRQPSPAPASSMSDTRPASPVISAATPRNDTPSVEILAHVARLGDVKAKPGEWLGGPSAPARIEGVSIGWKDKPEGVDLALRGTVAGGRPGAVISGGEGDYVGTRGKASPLVGLGIELVGPQARGFRLRGEFLFLGCHVFSESGRSIEIAGPTGREPLVGLRLWIERDTQDPGRKSRAGTSLPEISSIPAKSRPERGSAKVFRRTNSLAVG